jgi:proteasome lid subunit RPN8/RPN11
MGFLVGQAFSWQGREYAVVEEYLTSENDATSVSVRFSRRALEDLSQRIPKGKVIVGWAHSHPGYGCFLSNTDLGTQGFFSENFHFALVADPTKKERGAMLKRVFKIFLGEQRERPFAVIQEKSGSKRKSWFSWLFRKKRQ